MEEWMPIVAVVVVVIFFAMMSRPRSSRAIRELLKVAEADRDIRALDAVRDAVTKGRPIPRDLPFSQQELDYIVGESKRKYGK